MATPPGSPLRHTFRTLTRGISLSFGRIAASPSGPVPKTTVGSVSETQPPRALESASCGADGGASGCVQLILGENHAAQGGEAASWANTFTSQRAASGSAGIAVKILRGSREEGGAEHHGCIWGSAMHCLSNKVTSLFLDSFFSCFSYLSIRALHVFVFLFMMIHLSRATLPFRHWSILTISPPTKPTDCSRAAFWIYRWILRNHQNPPRRNPL